jgi:L1 cell adhesion molecule like protein
MENRATPLYVGFPEEERLVGDAAKNQTALNPSNTVFDAKGLIGRKFINPLVQSDMKHWPFKVVEGELDKSKVDGRWKMEMETRQFFSEEILAMVHWKMKETAENMLTQKVKDAVVTAPAYFNDSQ